MIVVFGRGRAGTFLFRRFRAAGANVSLRASSTIEDVSLSRGDVVFLCVPDPAVQPSAARLASRLVAGVTVFHCAGRFGAEALSICAPLAACGVFHPLISIVDASTAYDGTVVIDGDKGAIKKGKSLARTLGLNAVAAAVHGPAYHAAASLVAAGTATLIAQASRIAAEQGVARAQATQAMRGLAQSVLLNLSSHALVDALTGSVARGDAAALAAHRSALAHDVVALALYDAIALASIDLAKQRGVDASAVRAMKRELSASPGRTPQRRPRARSRR